MKLYAFTLVLNGMPWLPCIYTTLNQLGIPWHWIVVEGAAMNTHCSSHCTRIEPQLSHDGTGEFLKYISSRDKRVTVIAKHQWDGKIEMCNAALETIDEPCVLMQIDSDEIWDHYAIMAAYYQARGNNFPQCLSFRCDYLVGPGLIARSPMVNTDLTKWTRMWTFVPGDKFESHCPPVLNRATMSTPMSLRFTHYAYVLPQQVHFKQQYYGFSGMLDGWHRLQEQKTFPVLLRDFWPYRWVDEGTYVHEL